MDVVQQQLLAPLLQAARSPGEEPTEEGIASTPASHAASSTSSSGGTDGTDGTDGTPQPPPSVVLRAQVVTLAPSLSAYTLDVLRQMAFNLTEGYTYAGLSPVV